LLIHFIANRVEYDPIAKLPVLAATGGTMWATNEAMAAVLERGTESFVEYAASQGRTQAEAEKFARTAVWVVETVATSAAVVGVAKLSKNIAAATSKLGILKSNITSIAKNVYNRTQRAPQKIDMTSLDGIAKAVADSPAITIKRELYRGGAYGDIIKAPKPDGIEAHHIPPKSVSGISTVKGPAIQMLKEDHALTSSYKYSKKSIEYRNDMQKKVEAGDMRGAVATDFWDLRKLLPDGTKTKYNEAFKQMLEYGKTTSIIPDKK
jgi:hypothetical protein